MDMGWELPMRMVSSRKGVNAEPRPAQRASGGQNKRPKSTASRGILSAGPGRGGMTNASSEPTPCSRHSIWPSQTRFLSVASHRGKDLLTPADDLSMLVWTDRGLVLRFDSGWSVLGLFFLRNGSCPT
jgi:hypothetical protein